MLTEIAKRLVSAKRPLLARPFLDLALRMNPTNTKALGLLTPIDPAAALAFKEEAARKNPEDPDVWGRLATARLEAGDEEGAFLAYRRAATASSGSDRIKYLRGLITADPRAALPIVLELADDSGEDSLGVVGQAYLRNEMRGEAFESFARALELDPSDVGWLHHVVVADPARAIPHLSGVLERHTGDDRDEIVGALGLALLAAGDTATAYDRFVEASKIDDDDYEWLRGMAAADPERAAVILEKRVSADPGEGTLHGALGDAYAKLGRKEEAIAQYDKALETGGDAGRWQAALAAVDPDRGLAMLQKALDANPRNDELWGALGDAYRGLGRLDEARAAYDKALRLDGSDWEWIMRREQVR
jgi:tetratricopeptide (TPR) repeat protein